MIKNNKTRSIIEMLKKKYGVDLDYKTDKEMFDFLKKESPSLAKLLRMATNTKKKKPWVEYECGCQEGLGVSLDSICGFCNKKVVKYSNKVGLSPSKDQKDWIRI